MTYQKESLRTFRNCLDEVRCAEFQSALPVSRALSFPFLSSLSIHQRTALTRSSRLPFSACESAGFRLDFASISPRFAQESKEIEGSIEGSFLREALDAMSCVVDQTCLYVAGIPTASVWSGLPVLGVVLIFILDSVLGGVVGRVRSELGGERLGASERASERGREGGRERANQRGSEGASKRSATSCGEFGDGELEKPLSRRGDHRSWWCAMRAIRSRLWRRHPIDGPPVP